MSAKGTRKINYADMAKSVLDERKGQQREPAPTSEQTAQAGPEDSGKWTTPTSTARTSTPYTVQMTFRVMPEQRDALKRMALDYHTTVGDLIRWFINKLEDGEIIYPG